MNLVLSTCLFEMNLLPDLFPLLREAGFSQLEVVDRGDSDINMAILNDLIQKSRVYDIGIPNWHLLMESPFKETDEARKAAINRTKQSMDKGRRFGAKNHVLHWYHRFQDRSYDDLWRNIVDEWANYAEKLGIRLLMETVPDKPSNERYVSSSEITDFVRSYPPEVLSMCVDVNHSNLQEKLTDVVHMVNDRLVSLHVSDNDGNSEKHWLPGQGVIDFPSLFESLEAVEFDGMIVLEVGAWCEKPHLPSEIERLYEFGKTLLETKSPHPKTPRLNSTFDDRVRKDMMCGDNSDLPVAREVDVLVVGGGPAGVGAALAAARNGAKTLVVEQFNCLGGVATAGGHGHISKYDESGTGRRIVGGIADEVGNRVVDGGFGIRNSQGIWFEVEGLKLLLDQMAEESGVDLLYHTFFCDTVVEDGATAGVVVQNKNGRQVIRAKRVIDCTGDGDVAFHAGCPHEIGRPSDGKCQPVTLMFTIGGVDWEKASAWRTDYKMTNTWEEAQRNGDMRPFQKTIMGWWWTPTRPDQVGVNFTHVIYIDSTKAEDLTKATVEARKQAYETIEVYRKYVPGMEKCYMVSTPNTIGIRESRRIMGDYILSEDDVKSQREFDDNICYGSFFVDIHCIDGPGMDPTVWRPPKGFKYHIPYRILVPQGVENLLTAGRCVSCTHVALGSIRVMVPCIGMGEAAGTAAALSLGEGMTPRQLNVELLQRQLRKQGGILSENDIERAEEEARASNNSIHGTR